MAEIKQPLIDVNSLAPPPVQQEDKQVYTLNDKHMGLLRESSARLKELKWVHSRSAQYYDKMHNVFVIPTILITSISGMASFLSTSSVITEDTKTVFGIGVGVMASVSSLLQSMSSAYKYGTKAEMHRTAAEEYNKLIVKISFEMADPNEPKFIENLESKLLEVQSNCKYFPPQSICDKYQAD
jgi:hypothetical protein